MSGEDKLLQRMHKLRQKYLLLIEDAYNYRQIDHSLSDIAEYRSIKILNRINELKFVVKDTQYN
ncbi:Lacal_2735 family protein [Winogradskyella sp. E313]|uniref:Lacal_2735 family protein n=2 Tax=Winogradskyella immobilis TaxID=2816852 RepID=A0ABS8ENN8_9FLAO|nr:Lacal_2735 family protein [Winogradskyella immobilis]